MPPRTLTAALLALSAAACDRAAEGASAYRDGRFADARRAFASQAEGAGERASPELLYDLALASVRVGDADRADAALRRIGGDAPPSVRAAARFLAGNVAWLRCDVAEAQASMPEAEPFAYDVAIAHVRAARTAWAAAAEERADWAAARRNVARADRRVADLEAKKAEAMRRRRSERTPTARPQPAKRPAPPPPKPPDEETTAASDPSRGADADAARDATAELAPADVRRLLDRLAAKEREKAAARRAERQARSADVEKDW